MGCPEMPASLLSESAANRVAHIGSQYWPHLFAAVSDWLQVPSNRGNNSSALMLEQLRDYVTY